MAISIRAKAGADAATARKRALAVVEDEREPAQGPFDPLLFQAQASLIVSKLTDYLSDTSIRGLELLEPSALLRIAQNLTGHGVDCPAQSMEQRLEAIVDLYIRTGIQVHSPGSMGRQFSGVVPLAGIVETIGTIVNQPSSFYEAAQLPNVAERIMASELCALIGWKTDNACMVTTSGGSLANMTALLAARNDRFPGVWAGGFSSLGQSRRPAIAMSEDAHYSLCRATGVLGIGDQQIVRLPVNEKRQIAPEQVMPTLEAARRRGLEVFCLVASAGSTCVGAFDPIDEIAEITAAHDIWLHVDGAHGGSLLVSDRLRHKLRGIEKADSLTWDAHKMMFIPPMCTLLFYRDKRKSYGAFHQQASYVFEKKPDMYTEFETAEQGFECTKRPMIMSLWVLWALYGRKFFAEKIEYLVHLTRMAHEIVQEQPDFTAVHQPEVNIFCFRYVPAGVASDAVSELQVAIRNRIRKDGRFFISKTDVNGIAALRVVLTNYRTNAGHFRMLLDEIRRVGREIMEGANTDV